ncbi:sensor histidine kinase [Citricoccus sp. GCM10030269]|uniref:sensor histidine kinase n=1 Tax=Citricoccus sp. GCM10030269 TaxID=3273388 RepID=UPI00361D59DD
MTTARGTRLGDLWRQDAAIGTGPRGGDLWLTGVVIAMAVFEAIVRTDLDWPVPVAVVTVALLALLPWRRTHPLVGVAAIFVTTSALQIAQRSAGVGPDSLGTTVVLLAFPYALFRWGSGRARVCGAPLLALGVVLATVLSSGPDAVAAGLAGTSIVGTTAVLGAFNRERANARSREAERIRSQEREALARDLHDTVSHHVSAIAIRAQAAGLHADGGPVAEGLRVIEHEAQQALTQMRQLVGVLRAPAELAPTTLAAIAALETPGPPAVTVRMKAAELPATIASTLYRLAQEGVTNARRHATGASTITVEVSVRRNVAVLTVHDDGRVASPGTGASVGASIGDSAGYGLPGAAERTALLGGTFSAGPDGAGWTLRAEIPLSSSQPASMEGTPR